MVAGFVFGITAHNVVAVWTRSTLSVVVGRFFFRETIREKLFAADYPISRRWLLILEDEEHALAYQACSRFMVIPLFVDIPSWKISLACVSSRCVVFTSRCINWRFSVARFLPREGMVVCSAGFFVTVSPGSIEIASSHCSEQGKTYCMNLSAPYIMQVPPFKAVLMKMTCTDVESCSPTP